MSCTKLHLNNIFPLRCFDLWLPHISHRLPILARLGFLVTSPQAVDTYYTKTKNIGEYWVWNLSTKSLPSPRSCLQKDALPIMSSASSHFS